MNGSRVVALWVLLSVAWVQPMRGSAAERAGRDKQLVQREAAFLPLGVYWAGEYTFNEQKDPQVRWGMIDKALDDLAKHNVNSVWLTHMSAKDSAEFAGHAVRRGIFLVASIGELAGEVDHVRKSDHRALIARTLQAWGDAPPPIAWGLGDEPRTAYMDEMKSYVKAWRTYAPGEPLTTVVMWGDVAAGAKAGFDMLCVDPYPFFSAGNPNSFGVPPFVAWEQVARNLVKRVQVPWMMGQAYEEPWGPYELDEKGSIIYLPGGAPHWVMPTPAQIRWQAWSAFANGAKGMFYFHYRMHGGGNPNAPPAKLPAAAKQRTDSHTPRALVYDDGGPTPQYEAMGEVFGEIRQTAALLAPLKPVAAQEAWLEKAPPGTELRMLIHPQTQTRYLLVLGPYSGEGKQDVVVTLGPNVTSLKNARTGASALLTLSSPCRQLELALTPAQAEIFECVVDKDNLPQAYSDDFATEKFRTEALNGKEARVARYETASGCVLSAADGALTADAAFVVYDLEKLLEPLERDGFRLLVYHGTCNPQDVRGAFWSVSADGQSFRKLSSNEFGKPVMLFRPERYLKVGLSWCQAGDPSGYGCLTEFSLCQWKRPAK